MPAKKKYLAGGWKRLSKVLAIIFGAYFASAFLHIALAKNVLNDTPVLLTSAYTSFLVWTGLMVMVYTVSYTHLTLPTNSDECHMHAPSS